MRDQQISRLAETSLHMEKLDVLLADLIEDLLRFQRIKLLNCIFEALFNVWIDGATVLKLLHKFVHFLIFRHGVSVMHNLKRLTWLFLDDAVVSTTVYADAHLLAFVNHSLQHLEVLAWLCI